jgi:hypothetical protein
MIRSPFARFLTRPTLSILALAFASITTVTLEAGDPAITPALSLRLPSNKAVDGLALALGKSKSAHARATVVPAGGFSCASFDNGPFDSTTFIVGQFNTYDVTASGNPTPYIDFDYGSLPSSVSFSAGYGTATFSGTPVSGDGGTYNFGFYAYNYDSVNDEYCFVYQDFTLTVAEAPSFTSADNATFTVGEYSEFTVTTAGDPPMSIYSIGGDPPAGVQFNDNGDGTATLSGTPLVATDGLYTLSLEACNDIDCAFQNFELTVAPPSAASTPTDCTSAPSEMLGWWPGDGNLNDIVAGNDAVDAGNVTFTTGEVGQAMTFNGTSDYLTVANSPDPNSEYSFDAWVYWNGNINTSSHDGIVVKNNAANDNDSYSMFIFADDNSLYNVLDGQTYATLANSVPVGQWFHVAQTFDGSTAKVYINGNLATSFNGSRGSSTGTLAFGNRAGGTHFFNGLLDEIETFSRALTQDEVRAIFNAGSFGKCKCTPPPAGLIDWWPGDGNANDIIGAHDGTPQGDATFASGKVGQAFSFDGNGDFIDMGDVDLPSTFTIDAWIKPASLATSPYIITKADLSSSSYQLSLFSDGHLILSVANGAGGSTAYKTTDPVVTTGSWQQVAATYDGNAVAGQRIKLFINGVNVTTVVISDDGGNPSNNAVSTKIGIYGDLTNGPFNGLIDEVEIFSRVLCADEIAALYKASGAGKCKPRLNVDFNSDNPGPFSATQPGFLAFNVADGLEYSIFKNYSGIDLATSPLDNVTVGIHGPVNIASRDRTTIPPDAGAFTFSNLYRDLVSVAGGPLSISVTGLAPNRLFDVTFYAYDDANASNPVDNTDTFSNKTAGATFPSVSVTYGLNGGGPVSSNRQYSARLRVFSDANGNLSFDETSSGPQGGPVLNGLQVAPVPVSNPCAGPTPAALQLLNISSRASVGTGDDVAIGGFIIHDQPSGGTTRSTRGITSTKRVLIRGLGPSLAVNGTSVPGRLADPVLELRDSNGDIVTSNDDWGSAANSTDVTATGLAPTDSHESAILITLDSQAAYTAILRGKDPNTGDPAAGIGLVEVYDLEPTTDSHLANISTRGQVLINDDVLIGGIIVGGGDTQQILFRAIGPSLAVDGTPVPGALQDPQLDLHDAQGTLIAHNDNWREEPDGTLNGTRQNQISGTGLAPTNDAESAILYLFPPPGSYTVIVSGVGGTTGVALVEAYRLGSSARQ